MKREGHPAQERGINADAEDDLDYPLKYRGSSVSRTRQALLLSEGMKYVVMSPA